MNRFLIFLGSGILCQLAGWSQPILVPIRPPNPVDLGGKIFGHPPDPSKTRHYYVAAERELWDYAPEGRDAVCGKTIPASILAKRSESKLLYEQYTDASFQTKVDRNPSLGILGPVLRGVVGEYLEVTFLNRTERPLSIHPHGVKYDKDNEGSKYWPKPGLGASVEPNARFTYVWQLDENSGPMPNEPSSKAWLYHSHVNDDDEVNLGLIGLIIVTDPHRARPDGTPADVDREFASLFMIFDESVVKEIDDEPEEHAQNPALISPQDWARTQQLVQAGSRYAINGRIFGNLTGLDMIEGEHVRWYLFGMGSEQDFHTAHWHGVRVLEEGRRKTDVIELLPATMKTADFVADNPGTWLFHCHVAEHMEDGMFARYSIHPRTESWAKGTVSKFLGISPQLRLDAKP